KMGDVSRHGGRTVLFVSHNMGIVTSLCPKAIWLDRGTICQRGATREVVGEYLSRRVPEQDRFVRLGSIPRHYAGYVDRLRLESLEWLSDWPLRHGEPVKARIRFETVAPVAAVTIGIGFSSNDGTRLVTYETDFQEGFRPDLDKPGVFTAHVTIDALPLA